MVTDKNTIKIQFSDFLKAQKSTTKIFFICSLAALIIGAIGLVAYVAVGTVWETLYEYSPAWCEALLVSAVPFAFGLVFILALNSQTRQVKKLLGAVNEYEFYSDCIMVRELHGGQPTGVVRTEYRSIVKKYERGQYLFFRSPGGTGAYCIDKTTLSEDELNTIKKMLSMPLTENANIIELASSQQADAQVSV